MSRDSPAATAWAAGSPARFSLGVLEAGAFLVSEDFEATVADFDDPGRARPVLRRTVEIHVRDRALGDARARPAT